MLHVRRSFAAPELGFRLDSHLALAPRYRATAARVDGDVVFDGALVPREPRTGRTYVYIVLEGDLHVRGGDAHVPPRHLAWAESRAAVFEDARAYHIGAFRALALHVDRELLRPPPRLAVVPLDRSATAAAARAHDALGRAGDPATSQRELLVALRRAGLDVDAALALADAAPPPRSDAIGDALSRALSQTSTRPALVDLAFAPLSERTARRWLPVVARHYGFTYGGWRALRRAWSAILASIALTEPRATPALVARLLGFSGAQSLCHALDRAGVLPPRGLQEAAARVREDDAALRAAARPRRGRGRSSRRAGASARSGRRTA